MPLTITTINTGTITTKINLCQLQHFITNRNTTGQWRRAYSSAFRVDKPECFNVLRTRSLHDSTHLLAFNQRTAIFMIQINS